jgi:hypothetical protein
LISRRLRTQHPHHPHQQQQQQQQQHQSSFLFPELNYSTRLVEETFVSCRQRQFQRNGATVLKSQIVILLSGSTGFSLDETRMLAPSDGDDEENKDIDSQNHNYTSHTRQQ